MRIGLKAKSLSDWMREQSLIVNHNRDDTAKFLQTMLVSIEDAETETRKIVGQILVIHGLKFQEKIHGKFIRDCFSQGNSEVKKL